MHLLEHIGWSFESRRNRECRVRSCIQLFSDLAKKEGEAEGKRGKNRKTGCTHKKRKKEEAAGKQKRKKKLTKKKRRWRRPRPDFPENPSPCPQEGLFRAGMPSRPLWRATSFQTRYSKVHPIVIWVEISNDSVRIRPLSCKLASGLVCQIKVLLQCSRQHWFPL